ncbi:hypothetical protein [Streptomyces sp. NRRL WC-3742]|uniref:hypothetical protein n=1 Tax=Streptomyces sp. NRRL WC-3742 TaxID=1463934 RepID=UPI00068A456A|nr:hypothetical protein [Streptomyces sp. NRRL WC-3742]
MPGPRPEDTPSGGCDLWLPAYQWRSRHGRTVRAEQEAVARAVRAATPADLLTLRPLVFARSIPARLSRGGRWEAMADDVPVLDWLVDVVGAFPLDAPGGDVLVGFAGRPWALRQQWFTLSPQEYRDFDEPGCIKGLMAFSVRPRGGGALLCTETRVFATDRESVRRFGRYWTVIGPFSGLIRRDWLAAAARVAERTG